MSKLTHYFDVKGTQIFQNTLYRGGANIHYYFDVKGGQIFQNTLFRGVQTFIIILISGVFRATPFARLFFDIF